ncbi:hypothetical protein D3C81_1500780 [compost metagenome]
MDRHFVHTAAVHHGRPLITQYAQGFGNRQHQFRAVNADQRQRWACRVDQRAEHVEHRAGFQLLAYRHRMAETGVVLRGKQEAYAQFVQCLTCFFCRQIQANAKCCQQIR